MDFICVAALAMHFPLIVERCSSAGLSLDGLQAVSAPQSGEPLCYLQTKHRFVLDRKSTSKHGIMYPCSLESI